jgi:formylglycine-generating enzyme required for sulfatase activity
VLAPNTILQNRYRIVRELGHGGMGTVYEAIDQRVNCLVALKQTLANCSEETRTAFEREAALLANLRHSALPKVMDYFSEQDCSFLVMEFIPGHDFGELLDLRGSAFPEAQVLRWADELLKVLEYLHSQRPPILHRDIKPSNLKRTKQGEIFLLDFGLAKGSVGQMTLADSHSVRGYTPIYAPLEQIHGHGTDPRSDLYSLAATLYHFLTGVTPVDAPARYHASEDGQADPLPAIGTINPTVTPNVAAVIHQAMAMNRRHRPTTAAEMRQRLQEAAAQSDMTGIVPTQSSGITDGSSEPRVEAGRSSQDVQMSLSNAEVKPESADLPTTASPQVHDSSRQQSRLAATTMSGPSSEGLRTAESGAGRVPAEFLTSQSLPGKRVFVIGASLLAILIVIGIFAWLRPRSPRNSVAQNATAPISTPTTATVPLAGKPVHQTPAGMAYISGGDFIMGRDGGDDAERPPHPVTVKPFFIDAHEVTNEDYGRFVKATNHRPPPTWKTGSFPSGDELKPVTGVTWNDANDYARWAGKRLPTEEEWEFAARSSAGGLYPWGNDWQQGAANANGAERSVAQVGAYKGTSPFGIYDMVGNVWEWTASTFKPYPGRGLPASKPNDDLKVIRGGCYESTKDYATTTYRAGWPARGAYTYDQTGIRLAKDIVQ